jgi:hypothetical protein
MNSIRTALKPSQKLSIHQRGWYNQNCYSKNTGGVRETT